jgi:general secretion pathway protein F
MTLDELVAINDEIAAMVRAGVPLERGLTELGRELPGRLGRFAAALAERTARGEPLDRAILESAVGLPPLYRAVLEAGARAGRLSVALQLVASSSQRLSWARRMVIGSVLYPVLVLLLAWGLWVLFTVELAPRLVPLLVEMRVPGRGAVVAMAGWGESAAVWGPSLPLVVIVIVGAWWMASGRALVLEPRRAGLLLGWLPWTGSILRNSANAAFAELLAMLVESGVPLADSIRLAAQAAGDHKLISAARALADAIERGDLTHQPPASGELAPLLDWLILTGQERGALLPAVRLAAEQYQRRAMGEAQLACTFLPVVLTALLGGTVALVFALAMWGPWFSLMYTMAKP